MLNISEQSIAHEGIHERYDAFRQVINPRFVRVLSIWLLSILAGFIVLLFLPWTQNISSKGQLTTLRPEQRPQVIPAAIAGRVEQWYVTEGDTVLKGDTIVHLSEIKYDLADPALLERSLTQLQAKESAVSAYRQKAQAQARQIGSQQATLNLKLAQARNKAIQAGFKVQADSIDLVAADTALQVANRQALRADMLFQQGLKSRTEREDKLNKYQEVQAKWISQNNKLLSTRNELLNARIELNNLPNEYGEKVAKAQSERQSALSALAEAQGEVAKLQNQLSNYERRVGFRYITAPQDGLINKAFKPGLGETVKEGEKIVSIIPLAYDLAAELYIRPVDLPLLRKGANVRLQFDGWPAIVFSGWPNTSFGTFGGTVFAIESNISSNGLYRILVAPDPDDENLWPTPLRVGSGVQGFALLSDVPLWYELWRQLNGFPPDFYNGSAGYDDKKQKNTSKEKG